MKVLKPDAIPAEPTNNPLFTGGPVTRQTLLTPEMSHDFNLAIVNFSAGARNKMHIHSSDQILFVTAGKGIIATETRQEVIGVGDVDTFRQKRNIGTGPRLIPHSPTLL
jgi:quercetin dioxygenase-like cupin family protein